MEEFAAKFDTFVAGLNSRVSLINDEKITVRKGRRYMKVCRGGSVYAFVDTTNGDVLKPASWKAPAKHARGNIFADDNGLNCCGPYSVAYLR